MKITKRQLKRIIKEEQEKLKRQGLVKESRSESAINFHRGEMDFGGSLLDLDDHNMLEAQIDGIINNFIKMGYTREDVMHALKDILEEI